MKTQTATRAQRQPMKNRPSSALRAAPSSKMSWRFATKTLTGEPLTLRAATAADAAELATVGGKGFAAIHQSAVPEEDMQEALAMSWNEKQLAGMIENPEIQFLVAEIEQRIVGVICLNPTYRPGYLRRASQVELCQFYVHRDWIGYGVGSSLITLALRQAALTGYGICWLRVWQGNKSAINFYRRWGFTTIAADYYSVGDTVLPVWVMIHPLAGREEERIA